jgi:paraquat-inducible protein A
MSLVANGAIADITDAAAFISLQPMHTVVQHMAPWLLCPHCDLLIAPSRLDADQVARCPRCLVELERGTRVSRESALAIAASAVPLWLVMNAFPLVTLTLGGVRRDTTLSGAALALMGAGMPALAVLVAVTTIVIPAAEIALALYIIGRLESLLRSGGLGRAVRWFRRLKRWSMVDVFLLGCLVSVVKLSHLADIVVGPALWACAILLPVLAFVTVYVQPQRLFRSSYASRTA